MKYLFFLSAAIFLFACERTSTETTVVTTEKPLAIDEAFNSDKYNVAFLIMDGTFNTELTAPMDIFHHTKFRDSIKSMRVFTVANTSEAITTFEGLKILPDFNYTENHPRIDILVIPAAEHNLDTDLEDERLIQFVKEVGANATFVMSHCDGAFVLAKTGLLDDRVSTTFPGDVDDYKKMYPELEVRENLLFVRDGKFITSAGGAKSFEASLYLCEDLYGKKVADELAEGMVIDWDLESIPYEVISR
ncbi:MAG: DJ-1/PfpI family protein [Crocinitomicaceae bacterium]|nr:DJ-1/PfpI family protein [Crocinitomicaceae bacterium]